MPRVSARRGRASSASTSSKPERAGPKARAKRLKPAVAESAARSVEISSPQYGTRQETSKGISGFASAEDKENTVNRNENTSPTTPGATPYWKVAQERGGMSSPRLTRSSAKKKRSSILTENVVESIGGGIALNFSPPNQKRNRERERRELERKERERAKRIQKARMSGQLMMFSPPKEGGSSAESGSSDRCSLGGVDFSDSELPPESKSRFCLDLSADCSGTITPRCIHTKDSSNLEGINEKHVQEDAPVEGGTLFEASLFEHDTDSPTIATKTRAEDKIETVHQSTPGVQGDTEVTNADHSSASEVQEPSSEGESTSRGREEVRNGSSASETQEPSSEAESSGGDREKVQSGARDTHDSRILLEFKEMKTMFRDWAKVQAVATSSGATLAKTVADKMALQEIQRNENLIKSCAQLEMSNDLLKEEVKMLEAKLKQAEEKHENNNELLRCNGELKEKLAAAEETRDLLSKRTSQLEDNLNECRVNLEISKKASHRSQDELLTKIKTLSQVNDALSEELKKAQSVTHELESKVADMQHAIDGTNHEVVSLKQEVQRERTKVVSVQAKFNDVVVSKDNEIEALHAKLSVIDSELLELGEKSKDANESKKALENKAKKLEQELEAAVTSLRDAEEKFMSVTKSREAIKAAHSETVASLTRAEKDKKSMQADLDMLREENLELKDTLRVERERASTSDKREDELHRKLKVMNEIRRGLHDRVMQLSGNIRVYVRVRPVIAAERAEKSGQKRKHSEESPFHFPRLYDRDDQSPSSTGSSSSTDDATKHMLHFTEPYKDRGGLNPRRKKWRYGFDNIFSPDQGQDDVWEATEPLVQSAIDGYNVTVFAYGQTGSGKTFTMLGEPGNEGLVSRAVRKMFGAKNEIESSSWGATSVNISIELLEIYNEQVRDLLCPKSGPSGKEISLKVNSKEAVGNVLVAASCEGDVADILELASSRRSVKATKSNSQSSRSHMLFTMHFTVNNSDDGFSRAGKLHICDLAGSERLNKSESRGALLKETQNINKSLSALSNVIEKLQSKKSHIPFRESKLTYLLQNSLGGNSKTLCVVCCNPLPEHYHESLCSLRFAAKVSNVELQAHSNITV